MSQFVKSFARVIETILHGCRYCGKNPTRTQSAARDCGCLRVPRQPTWSGDASIRWATSTNDKRGAIAGTSVRDRRPPKFDIPTVRLCDNLKMVGRIANGQSM